MEPRPERGGFDHAFDELLSEHDQVGSPLRDFVRPGADPARVASALAALDGPSRLALSTWYDRFDGIDQGRYERARGKRVAIGLYPGGYPMALAETEEAYHDLREEAERLERWTEGKLRSDAYWRRSWWPIISAEPATIAVNADGSVLRIEWDPERGPVVDERCPSLSDFVAAIVDEFRSGSYAWNEDAGLLRMSDPAASPATPSCA